MQRIDVKPFTGGAWQVTLDGVDNPLVYRSGARAEAAGRALAARLADEGVSSEVVITTRDGCVAARITTSPPLPRRAA